MVFSIFIGNLRRLFDIVVVVFPHLEWASYRDLLLVNAQWDTLDSIAVRNQIKRNAEEEDGQV